MFKTLTDVVNINAKPLEESPRHLTFLLHSSLKTHFIQPQYTIKNTLYKMDIKKMWH